MATDLKHDNSGAMHIWLIDAGLAGHTIQVDTIGRILEQKTGATCEWVHAKLSLRGSFRSLARRCVDRVPLRMAPALLRIMYRGVSLPAGHPDLIVSSNSPTSSLCRLLTRITGAPAIFLGELHPPQSNWFALVIAVDAIEIPNAMRTPLLQTGQTAEKAAAAAATFWPTGIPTRCWTMIVGGDGKSHTFRANEWRILAESMNRAAKENGIRWLISTSRRTGSDNEAILRETLDPAVVGEAIWWATQPKKGLAAFIHAGERVFVTRDSLTMLSEAIAIKGRVEVVSPSDHRLNAESVHERFLQRLEADGRLDSHPVTELGPLSNPSPPVSIEDAQDAFAAELADRVQKLLGR